MPAIWASRTGIELCGTATNADEAMAGLEASDPSPVLVDLSLPGRGGFELIREIRQSLALPCVVLSGHGNLRHVEQAFSAGARGYVLKGRPADVVRAIRDVMDGNRYVSAALRDGGNGADRGARQ